MDSFNGYFNEFQNDPKDKRNKMKKTSAISVEKVRMAPRNPILFRLHSFEPSAISHGEFENSRKSGAFPVLEMDNDDSFFSNQLEEPETASDNGREIPILRTSEQVKEIEDPNHVPKKNNFTERVLSTQLNTKGATKTQNHRRNPSKKVIFFDDSFGEGLAGLSSNRSIPISSRNSHTEDILQNLDSSQLSKLMIDNAKNSGQCGCTGNVTNCLLI